MRIAQPKLVFNPYEWLPGYGESKVAFRSSGGDALIEIEYERDTLDADKNEVVLNIRREIIFKGASVFLRLPFPSAEIFRFDGDPDEFRLGSLTEFTDSELVEASARDRLAVAGHSPHRLRHFSIQFLSENVAFHVLAEDVSLSSEIVID